MQEDFSVNNASCQFAGLQTWYLVVLQEKGRAHWEDVRTLWRCI
jgi:hypothetical protein